MTAASDRLKAKISALRAKTTGAGCTEAEAMAAAEVAARLMREHGLSEDELVMTESTAAEASSRPNWRWDLVNTIAAVTNTAAIWQWNRQFLFIGRSPGPEVAAYLRDLCVRSVEAEVKRFQAGEFYRRRRNLRTRRAATTDFTDAMVLRLRQRLTALFRESRDPTALAAAQRVLDARFPDTRECGRSARDPRFQDAAWAGHRAGDRARLDRGVTNAGTAPAGLIERAS
ncbi:Protein of unknown function [Methylobacterium sp. UNC378MF]|uniref:DUF7168 domain-containing protein n=1 Tax=Methylobacterium sp. UNC378MF TaxID=1502748 RepID=UPI00088CD038|nr:DUF2786 domain-containing protein [Methylobacterium sp. UNC378MF]SDA13132.1 Protein of unknown function [Methylobacterium sp. UNC378MF]